MTGGARLVKSRRPQTKTIRIRLISMKNLTSTANRSLGSLAKRRTQTLVRSGRKIQILIVATRANVLFSRRTVIQSRGTSPTAVSIEMNYPLRVPRRIWKGV